MERELIITVKRDDYSDDRVKKEIEYVKSLFPFLESYKTFLNCNQVYDLEQHTIVKKQSRLKAIFKEGTQKNNSFIVSLN